MPALAWCVAGFSRAMYVTRGTCGVYVAKADAEGRLRLPGERVALLETGSFFGEMSTRRTGRTASIIVESHRCELMHLAKEDWDGILVRDSNFAEKVATTAEGRFHIRERHAVYAWRTWRPNNEAGHNGRTTDSAWIQL